MIRWKASPCSSRRVTALSSLIWEPTETQYLIDARAESDARTLRATVIRHHVRGWSEAHTSPFRTSAADLVICSTAGFSKLTGAGDGCIERPREAAYRGHWRARLRHGIGGHVPRSIDRGQQCVGGGIRRPAVESPHGDRSSTRRPEPEGQKNRPRARVVGWAIQGEACHCGNPQSLNASGSVGQIGQPVNVTMVVDDPTHAQVPSGHAQVA